MQIRYKPIPEFIIQKFGKRGSILVLNFLDKEMERKATETMEKQEYGFRDHIDKVLRPEVQASFSLIREENHHFRNDMREEFAYFRSEMRQDMELFKADMEQFKLDMRAEMESFKADIKAEMEQFKLDIRAEMESFKTDIKADMEQFKLDIRAEMESFKTDIKAEMDSFKSEIRADIKELRDHIIDIKTDLNRQTKWIVAVVVTFSLLLPALDKVLSRF